MDPQDRLRIVLGELGPELVASIVSLLPRVQAARLLKLMDRPWRCSAAEREQALEAFCNVLASAPAQVAHVAQWESFFRAMSGHPNLAPQLSAPDFAFLNEVDPERLALMLRKERATVVGWVLVYVRSRVAAELLRHFDPMYRASVLQAIARGQPPAAELLELLATTLRSAVAAVSQDTRSARNGLDQVVGVLEAMDETTRERHLQDLSRRDPELYLQIVERMQRFLSLAELPSEAWRLLSTAVERTTWLVALRGSCAPVREAYLATLSRRSAERFLDDLHAAQPRRISEVEEAQRAVVAKVLELQAEGKLPRKGEKWI